MTYCVRWKVTYLSNTETDYKSVGPMGRWGDGWSVGFIRSFIRTVGLQMDVNIKDHKRVFTVWWGDDHVQRLAEFAMKAPTVYIFR